MCVNEEEFQVGLDDYYSVRGWNANGVPTIEKLNALGLSQYASIAQGGN
jgi:aldehyde:ferredoxin oxidoreductase